MPLDHDGPSHDAPSESDSEEKNSIGNHDGDLVNNSHLDYGYSTCNANTVLITC